MAEQPGERRVTAQVREELIRLTVPDVDPELVHLMLSRAAGSAAGYRDDGEGRQDRGEETQGGLVGELAELLALIRDAGISRSLLRAILGLDPETVPAGESSPDPPAQ